MLKFFKQYNPIVALPLLALGIFLWLPFRAGGEDQMFYYQLHPEPLFQWVFAFTEASAVWSKVLGLLMVLLVAALMVQLNIRFFFLGERSYLPALFYIGIAGSFGFLQIFNPVYLLATALLFMFFKVLETYRYERIAYQFLDIGLIIMVVSLFYMPSLFFVPLVWMLQTILRPFRWKESAFVVLGFAVPSILLAGILFFSGSQYVAKYIDGFTPSESFKYAFGATQLFFLTFLLFIILLASLILFRTLISRKIHIRRTFQVFFTFFMYAVLIYFTIPLFSAELIAIAAVPVSFLLSDFFIFNSRRRWVRIVFVVFWIVVIGNKILPYAEKFLLSLF